MGGDQASAGQVEENQPESIAHPSVSETRVGRAWIRLAATQRKHMRAKGTDISGRESMGLD